MHLQVERVGDTIRRITFIKPSRICEGVLRGGGGW